MNAEELELPKRLTEQIEKAFMHCTVEIPDINDNIRATTFDVFNNIVSQLMKLAYTDGVIQGLKKAEELINRVEPNY